MNKKYPMVTKNKFNHKVLILISMTITITITMMMKLTMTMKMELGCNYLLILAMSHH